MTAPAMPAKWPRSSTDGAVRRFEFQKNPMTAPDRKIRWGVLGYARIARETLIPAIQRSSNAVFHAIASREHAKLTECQARYPVPRAHRGYEELLRDPEVDAVYIPLP